MMAKIKTWLRAIALLSDKELLQSLIESRDEFRQVSKLRRAFPSCYIDPLIQVHCDALENIHLGDRVRLARGVIIALSGPASAAPRLAIGRGTYIGEYCNLRAAEGTVIEIGESCLISQFCSIVADNHATPRGQLISSSGIDTARRGVTIESDAWLGVGTSVLAGVRIGRGAVVGANSVVNSSVPDDEIWAGSPARKIGSRE